MQNAFHLGGVRMVFVVFTDLTCAVVDYWIPDA